jgi:uncharacterized membrane protein
MPDAVVQGLGMLVRGLEIAGAGALVLGFIITTVRWFLDTRRQGLVAAVERYERALGRATLIGLEILVAATIIKTITAEQTVGGMSLLAIMIVIRTALGWSTVLEMDSRWPWQKLQSDAAVTKTTS